MVIFSIISSRFRESDAFKEFLSVLFLLDQPPGTPLRTRNLTSYQFFCPHTFDIFVYSFLAPPERECIFMYVHKGTHTSVLLWEIFESFISLLTLIFPFSMFFCDVCDLAKNLQRTPRRLLPSLVHHQNQLLMNRRQKVGETLCIYGFVFLFDKV